MEIYNPVLVDVVPDNPFTIGLYRAMVSDIDRNKLKESVYSGKIHFDIFYTHRQDFLHKPNYLITCHLSASQSPDIFLQY